MECHGFNLGYPWNGWLYNIIWLVVYLPHWKIWVRQLGWWHSQLNGTIKVMFQSPSTSLSITINTLFIHYYTSHHQPEILKSSKVVIFNLDLTGPKKNHPWRQRKQTVGVPQGCSRPNTIENYSGMTSARSYIRYCFCKNRPAKFEWIKWQYDHSAYWICHNKDNGHRMWPPIWLYYNHPPSF